MEDTKTNAQKAATIIAKIKAKQEFVRTYRSQMRTLEVLQAGGVYKKLEEDIAKAQKDADYYNGILKQKLDKMQSTKDSAALIEKWLEERRDEFESLEQMLSDEAFQIIKDLDKIDVDKIE